MNSHDRMALDLLLSLDADEALDVLADLNPEEAEYANALLESCAAVFAQRELMLDQLCPVEDPEIVLAARPAGTTLH
jgi:hypothetical protein